MKKKYLTRIKSKIITGLYILYETLSIIGVILVESICGSSEHQKEKIEK
jgi:hypothetical protein